MTTASARSTADIAEFLGRTSAGPSEGHYYAALLGLRRYDAAHLVNQIQGGLSYSAFERFIRNTTLSQQVVAELVAISDRTLARRKESGRLDPEESDRLTRAARVFSRALELFEGDAEAAKEWLSQPAQALGAQIPLELARTDVGAIEVGNLVGRLEHGITV